MVGRLLDRREADQLENLAALAVDVLGGFEAATEFLKQRTRERRRMGHQFAVLVFELVDDFVGDDPVDLAGNHQRVGRDGGIGHTGGNRVERKGNVGSDLQIVPLLLQHHASQELSDSRRRVVGEGGDLRRLERGDLEDGLLVDRTRLDDDLLGSHVALRLQYPAAVEEADPSVLEDLPACRNRRACAVPVDDDSRDEVVHGPFDEIGEAAVRLRQNRGGAARGFVHQDDRRFGLGGTRRTIQGNQAVRVRLIDREGRERTISGGRFGREGEDQRPFDAAALQIGKVRRKDDLVQRAGRELRRRLEGGDSPGEIERHGGGQGLSS